jgi:hypothetical protein
VEKSQICDDITITEPIVELYAVYDLDATVEIDVLSTQITVAISYAAIGDTVLEKSAPVMKECAAHFPDEFPPFTVKKAVHKRFNLLKILLHVESDNFRITVVVNLGIVLTAGIELGQMPPELRQLIVRDGSSLQEFHQACLSRQAPHFHGKFQCLSRIEPVPPPFVSANAHDFVVYVSGEALVEEDFSQAEMVPVVKCVEIQEAETHRLLEFVNPISSKKDKRDMSFPDFNLFDGMGIEGRLGHGLADILEKK